MNRVSLPQKIGRLLRGRCPYEAIHVADILKQYVSQEEMARRFSDFPLKNFTGLCHEEITNRTVLLNYKDTPQLPIIESLALGTTASKLHRFPFCSREKRNGLVISDFDLGPKEIREEFKINLKEKHILQTTYHLNLAQTRDGEKNKYLKISLDRFPQAGQLLDSILVFCNLPNPRYYSTSIREISRLQSSTSKQTY